MARLNKQTFFAEVKKKLFPKKFVGVNGSSQIEGLDILIDEWEKRPSVSTNFFAYILATVYHETAFTMQPVKEYGGEDYLKRKKYYPWVGRGYAQLTWEENYKKAGDKIGVDLIKNPEAAMIPANAVKILFDGMLEGWFTGKSLKNHIDDLDEDDEEDGREYQESRRIINGVDKKKIIANYAIEFEHCLRKAEITNTVPMEKSPEIPASGAGAAGGAVILIEPVGEMIKSIEGQKNAFNTGSVVMMVIGSIVLLFSLYILYARWDAAGRPNIFRKEVK